MKQNKNRLLTNSALVLAASAALYGTNAAAADAYATASAKPAATAPSAGLANDWLREQSATFKPWDFGGQIRVREELKNNFAAPGQAGAIDFRAKGGNPHNDYLLLREKVHVGYNHPWFSVYVEGRNSTEGGDDRDPNPEADEFDLYQGYVTVGNPKEFGLTLKAGRQELAYGDERLVGPLDWVNIPRTFDAVKLRYEGKAG